MSQDWLHIWRMPTQLHTAVQCRAALRKYACCRQLQGQLCDSPAAATPAYVEVHLEVAPCCLGVIQLCRSLLQVATLCSAQARQLAALVSIARSF